MANHEQKEELIVSNWSGAEAGKAGQPGQAGAGRAGQPAGGSLSSMPSRMSSLELEEGMPNDRNEAALAGRSRPNQAQGDGGHGPGRPTLNGSAELVNGAGGASSFGAH